MKNSKRSKCHFISFGTPKNGRNVEKRISLDEFSIVRKDRPPRPRATTVSTRVTSPIGEDDPHRGHLAHGRGRPALRSPRPWERTTRTEVTSPMGEDDPHRGHLTHGTGRPTPRSPRPWARTDLLSRNRASSPKFP
ncbi:hypothetical protein F2Q69_00028896 [Brassica cretica]|uniref:Uncharacterized protein n=1 Tax=Brassica cretica TaxID=69181 RepID=A0A8S9RWB9_BRACR|nr:hypothetical protein F2Q69_00028896 [Brassica cretica]